MKLICVLFCAEPQEGVDGKGDEVGKGGVRGGGGIWIVRSQGERGGRRRVYIWE